MADDFPKDMFPEAEIPLPAQIKGVEREIKFRKRVYARRISQGRMSHVFADQQIQLMEAVLDTLKDLDYTSQDVATAVLHHIDTMYPAMWDAVAKAARTSIRNTILQEISRRKGKG